MRTLHQVILFKLIADVPLHLLQEKMRTDLKAVPDGVREQLIALLLWWFACARRKPMPKGSSAFVATTRTTRKRSAPEHAVRRK
jgi:hypothetical protein